MALRSTIPATGTPCASAHRVEAPAEHPCADATGGDALAMRGDPEAPHWFACAGAVATNAIDAARDRVRLGLVDRSEAAPSEPGPSPEPNPEPRPGPEGLSARETCTLALAASPHCAACAPSALRQLDLLVRTYRPRTLTIFRHASLRAVAAYLDDVESVPATPCEPLGALISGRWNDTAVVMASAPSYPFSPSNAFYEGIGVRLAARAAIIGSGRPE